jgi:hypothetical protein
MTLDRAVTALVLGVMLAGAVVLAMQIVVGLL